MALKPGALGPLIEIDLFVGIVGFALSVVWGKFTRRDMVRDTVLFLGKMFGGISFVFLIIIFLDR